MEKHSNGADFNKLNDGKGFFDAMLKNGARLTRPALDSAINQLSNHDHSRFLTRTNRTVGTLKSMGGAAAGENVDKSVLFLAVLIQMTWTGSPTLYYGDEVGQVGWTDPDCRRTFPWGREDWEVYDVYKSAIALRKKIDCLKLGSLMPLDAGNGYIVYARFNKNDCAVIAINSSEKEISLTLPVWRVTGERTDELKNAFIVGADWNAYPEKINVKFGRSIIVMPPKSGCVYTKKFE